MPITLDCPPVQSFHNTTANFKVHASITFLVNGGARLLLMVYFLKHLETSPFHWGRFCRCMIKTQPCFPSCKKRFHKWRPDSDLLGLQLRGNLGESSASCLSRLMYKSKWHNLLGVSDLFQNAGSQHCFRFFSSHGKENSDRSEMEARLKLTVLHFEVLKHSGG